jgi:hypothetical protein
MIAAQTFFDSLRLRGFAREMFFNFLRFRETAIPRVLCVKHSLRLRGFAREMFFHFSRFRETAILSVLCVKHSLRLVYINKIIFPSYLESF